MWPFCSAKVCSSAIFGTCFSYDCCNWLLYALLQNYAISIDSYSPINKFYSFIFFSLLINAVILLLICLGLVLYLYIHFLSLRCYFLYLNIIWTFIEVTLRWKYPGLCTVSLLLYVMVLKTIPQAVGYGHLWCYFSYFQLDLYREICFSSSICKSIICFLVLSLLDDVTMQL